MKKNLFEIQCENCYATYQLMTEMSDNDLSLNKCPICIRDDEVVEKE